MRIAVIGAGAAGCFCAAELSRRVPGAEIDIYEGGAAPMAKLALTGGGRCNITNSFGFVKSVAEAYPRGAALMKGALRAFGPEDTLNWFRREGVEFVLADDGCWFPASQDARQICNTLGRILRQGGVRTHCRCRVSSIRRSGSGFLLRAGSSEVQADKLIIASGGRHSSAGYSFLDGLGLEIIPPVPSLFTFCVPNSSLNALSGTVAGNVRLSLIGGNISSAGTLLITHWGMSGPAALKLSAHAARLLAERSYKAELSVNWLNCNEEECRGLLSALAAENAPKLLSNARPTDLAQRLWEHLLARAGMRPDMRWGELGRKGLNRLTGVICADSYLMDGRWTHKEEFVTCGGVALPCLDKSTMECKSVPGAYIIGEAADIDAITGGFNLQAAWTTAMLSARAIEKLEKNIVIQK
ncbi:MAG: aminoacetone oxidase family FAD-binding enzyme [Bacteroidales bacterium]|nr:aminoacetone oxidase family FAD-binding enzyme [Bacteroidales bacterium]